jgi:hypothetical protein
MPGIILVADHLSRSSNNSHDTGENLTLVLATSILQSCVTLPFWNFHEQDYFSLFFPLLDAMAVE